MLLFGGTALSDSSDGERLEKIIAHYMRTVEAGSPTSRDDLYREHPELAKELRDFFRHRDRMEALLDPLRDAAQRVLNIRCPHCRASVELRDEDQLSAVACPECGNHFSLVDSTLSGRTEGLERIGQFRLIEQVGSGQFGTVWKAEDMALERTVALKVPRARRMTKTEVEVFLRDARVAAQLRHPNIVSVHEVGKHEEAIYIVSDFVQGVTLKDWLETRKPTFREITLLCGKIGGALHYAHEQGIVHRDLKPGNVMMDLLGDPHIVDFGMAKRDVGELTITMEGDILGTPAYMSPEQARGASSTADRRADIYSTGVIMYEMLTGELPFRGDQLMLLQQIQLDTPPAPRKLNHRIPADLENICLKCLEKDPRHRYETAAEFADDCHRFLEGRDVHARPVPAIVQSFRWCRRNPAVASLLTTVGILLAVVALVSVFSQQRTKKLLGLSESRAETIEELLYYSEMMRAGLAASTSEGMSEVHRLVSNWEPTSDTDLRGWEWYYLESLLHQDRDTFDFRGEITALDFSPDGKQVAAGNEYGEVTVWTLDGQLVHVFDGQTFAKDIAWSPTGIYLAIGNSDGRVHIWNAVEKSKFTELEHSGVVYRVEWQGNDDRRLLVTNRSADGGKAVVTVWDHIARSKIEQRFQALDRLSRVAWHPDANRMALSTGYGPVTLFDPATPEDSIQFGGESWQVESMLWSPTGDRLAVSDRASASIQFWNLSLHAKECELDSKSPVHLMAWAPKGSLFAFADGNKEVQLYDLSDTQGTRLKTLQGHLDRVTAICFHPDQPLVVTGSIDGEIKLWDIEPSADSKLGSAFVKWRPNQDSWATSAGKTLQIGASSGAGISRMAQQKENLIDATWSPDGSRVASIDYYGIICVWDMETEKCIFEFDAMVPPTGTRLPAILAWHPTQPWLAFPDSDKFACILNIETGEVQAKFAENYIRINCMAWNPSGSHLAVGSRDGLIHVLDIKTNRPAYRFEHHGHEEISSIDWSPDGQKLVASASNAGVVVYDVADPGHPKLFSGHNDYVHSVDWSPDGTRIASGDQSGFVRIWDANSGRQTLVLQHPLGAVPHVAWHPNGRSLAAASFGGPAGIHVWNAPKYATEIVSSSPQPDSEMDER